MLFHADIERKELLTTNSLHYGRAAFEGIRTYKSSETGKAYPFKFHEHMTRLEDSCRSGEIALPEPIEKISSRVLDLINKHSDRELYVRPIIYEAEGLGELGLDYPTKLGVVAWEWQPNFNTSGETLLLSEIHRPSRNSGPVYSKLSGNYLQLKIAAQRARKQGYDDALLLTSDHQISEATARNVFFRIDKILYTPPEKSCLSGITRSWTINAAKKLGYVVKEEDLTPSIINSASEVFLTSTASEITSVSLISANGSSYRYADNELCRQLTQLYREETR